MASLPIIVLAYAQLIDPEPIMGPAMLSFQRRQEEEIKIRPDPEEPLGMAIPDFQCAGRIIRTLTI